MAAALVLIFTLASVAGVSSPAHADSVRDKQWHLDYLQVAQLHKMTKGKGVTVGVIDTGVDAGHPDLAGNVLKGRDFIERGDGWTDKVGHGTAMASLIAAHGHGPSGRDGALGIAPEANVLPGRIDFGEDATADVNRAIDWAVGHDVDVMNLSFHGGGGLSHVETALASDVVVVASAGNTEQGVYEVGVPAAYQGVLAVTGVDQDGNFTERSTRGEGVVLAAPMVDIMAAGAGKRGTYATATGTSDAAAIVSGVAALIRAKYPDISANGVINRLIKTADDKGPPGRDDKYGYGVINPLKALTADIPDVNYNPLIEEEDPSPSPNATTPPAAKADNDKARGTNYLLPAFAGGAAFVILIGLGAYFFTLVRRNRLGRRVNAPRPSDALWQRDPSRVPPSHAPGAVPSPGNPMRAQHQAGSSPRASGGAPSGDGPPSESPAGQGSSRPQ